MGNRVDGRKRVGDEGQWQHRCGRAKNQPSSHTKRVWTCKATTSPPFLARKPLDAGKCQTDHPKVDDSYDANNVEKNYLLLKLLSRRCRNTLLKVGWLTDWLQWLTFPNCQSLVVCCFCSLPRLRVSRGPAMTHLESRLPPKRILRGHKVQLGMRKGCLSVCLLQEVRSVCASILTFPRNRYAVKLQTF